MPDSCRSGWWSNGAKGVVISDQSVGAKAGSSAAAAVSAAEREDRLATFAERAGALGVRVERVPASDEAAEIIAAIAREIGAARAIVADELTAAWPALAPALAAAGLANDAPGEPATTRDAPLGVSLARLAIAETGSVMLAERTLTDRAVGLLTLTHVVLCPTEALVPSLTDAGDALRAVAAQAGGGYATLVTGPSRTADIELTLTVGVQGPRRVIVLFVDRWE